MNKVLTLIVFLAVVGFCEAKDFKINKSTQKQSAPVVDITSEKLETTENFNKHNQVQHIIGTNLLVQERFYWMHFNRTTPFAYDPSTDAIGIAVTERMFNPNNTFNGAKSYMLRSTNKGQTWDSVHVYRDKEDANPFYPSLAFVNASNSSNVEDLNYIFTSNQTIRRNATDTDWETVNGLIFSIYDKQLGTDPVSQLETKPELANFNDSQDWDMLNMGRNEATNTIYGWGFLQPTVTGTNQYNGYYGYWDFSFSEQFIKSKSPEQWWANKFRDSEDKNTTFNGYMEVTTDEAGTLFACVNNIYFEDEQSRLLGVSKSTDNGATWSSFEKMPLEVQNSLLNNHEGYNSVFALDPYAKSAVFSRGENKISFITPMIFQGEGVDALGYLVEMTYDDGVFGIRELFEIETDGPDVIFQHSSTSQNASAYKAKKIDSQFGNNIQVSKTADGDNIVMMWIDAVPGEVIKFPPVSIFEDQIDPNTQQQVEVTVTLDSTFQYDIFAATYNLINNEWSTPVNITKDDSTEIYFNIPEVVPSINRVPVLSYKGLNNGRTNVSNLPQQLVHSQIDDNTLLTYAEIDATKTQVKNSVENSLGFDVKLGDAYPNPAISTDNVEISFSVENPTMATVSLFDNMGNKVKTLLNQQVDNNGTKYFNADISGLNSGTYYYQLNISGHTFTKKLVIVK